MNEPQNESVSNRADPRGGDQSSSAWGFAGDALRELQRITEDDTRGSVCADDKEWCKLQSESLVSWAEKRECVVQADEFRRLTDGLIELKSGYEHRVLSISEFGRILKVTIPPYFGIRFDLVNYIDNILWSNALFEDDIRVIAVLPEDEFASVVTTQPFIMGRPPTDIEIETWFKAQGYSEVGKYKWTHPITGTEIEDAHPGNLLVMKDGTVAPIDLQILKLGTFRAKLAIER